MVKLHRWTEEEDSIVRNNYQTASKASLMEKLADRTLYSIETRLYVIPSMQYKTLPKIPSVKCSICGVEFVPTRGQYLRCLVRGWKIICPNPECKRINKRESNLRYRQNKRNAGGS